MKKTEFTIYTTIDGKNATAINIEREREQSLHTAKFQQFKAISCV